MCRAHGSLNLTVAVHDSIHDFALEIQEQEEDLAFIQAVKIKVAQDTVTDRFFKHRDAEGEWEFFDFSIEMKDLGIDKFVLGRHCK